MVSENDRSILRSLCPHYGCEVVIIYISVSPGDKACIQISAVIYHPLAAYADLRDTNILFDQTDDTAFLQELLFQAYVLADRCALSYAWNRRA